jgi:hypothetical protein
MFDNRTQHIPECFTRKIAYDNLLDEMRATDVVSMKEWQKARDEQEHARYSCRKLISLNRGGSGVAA